MGSRRGDLGNGSKVPKSVEGVCVDGVNAKLFNGLLFGGTGERRELEKLESSREEVSGE